MINPYLPMEAEVIERIEETPMISTLRLRIKDTDSHKRYQFAPGQFNMLYLHGVGEVPISIVSDPIDDHLLDHTIRAVGRVTRSLTRLESGARIGVRGPYGRGWPLEQARGRDLLLVTGGLGCAPMVSVIRYIMKRREQYGRLTIVQGVKHSADLIWRTQYERWREAPDTEVLLAADQAGPGWPWHVGRITELLEQTSIDPARTLCLLCGPELMMLACAKHALQRGLNGEAIHLSMERNMQCAVGYCGNCQFGAKFLCRHGPVFAYTELREHLGVQGY